MLATRTEPSGRKPRPHGSSPSGSEKTCSTSPCSSTAITALAKMSENQSLPSCQRGASANRKPPASGVTTVAPSRVRGDGGRRRVQLRLEVLEVRQHLLG